MNIASISVPKTAQTLLLVDLIILGAAVGILTNFTAPFNISESWNKNNNTLFTPIMPILPAVIYSVVILAFLFVMGLYQRVYIHGTRLLKSGLTAGLLIWLCAGWPIAGARLLNSDISTHEFLIIHVVLLAVLLAARPTICFYYNRFARKRRIALVGSEPKLSVFSGMISRTVPSEFVIVQSKQVNSVEDKDYLKSILHDLSMRPDIDQIIVDLPFQEFEILNANNKLVQLKGNREVLVPMSAVIEQCARWSGIEEAEYNVAHIRHDPIARSVKYWVETLIALCGLIFVLPIMISVAIAIKLDDGGPIFYRQKRVGRLNRVFVVLKFRSMLQDAEADGKARWATIGDTRVTRIGRFIRMTRIDELPQLINIIRGDMALVGPRPERPEMVSEIEAQIPGYSLRHRVRPGLTGWAQINLPYSANIEETMRKTQLDIYYIKHWSIWLDLAIIAQTIRIVLFAEGAR
ncbi:exopolysaccharide biosynthesis polyprenyl glycosylphosphotransferase [Sneathiella litorea]|uniref:Exopolysaccharide biosynthesis polyprenyl glycosylphosphotransferase n=1 Tax=Sneathiella litorea TaxID=2606216 RepID=A0A6L8WBE9_9PROT|nr:exopolysaccharide biosynthesis polyprenyl glycosylphosphotransferase [Sneathiella litorea]MZR32395.1 exopolysaccharide biosynthesis polyprenyl glycosylphosphotransferase [Sneathiella litorea]